MLELCFVCVRVENDKQDWQTGRLGKQWKVNRMNLDAQYCLQIPQECGNL